MSNKKSLAIITLILLSTLLMLCLFSCSTEQYTVTFDADGGSAVETQIVEEGKNAQKPENPTKEGYNFLGWYAGDEEWSFVGFPVNDNIILKAKWEKKTYTVTFDANGGNGSTEKTVQHGSKASAPMVSKPNYSLIGWFNGDTQWSFDNEITSDIILTAKWEGFPKKITFDANKGTVSEAERTVLYGSEIGTLPTPERFLYVFVGWYEESDVNFENKILETAIVNDNMSLKARWEMDDTLISIEFDANNGTLDENEEIKYIKRDTATGTLPVPERKGYRFDGWYNQNEELISEETVINRNIILFAKWSPLSNIVTFDANEGTVSETERTVFSGNQIGMLPIPERENYVFLGWYEQDDVNFENPILVTSVVTGDMALVAKWESNDILKIVIFLPNEGIISENEIVKYVTKDNEIGTLPVPKRAGYNFEGWYYSNGEKASSTDVVTDNTILIANWVNYITTPCTNGGTNHTWSMWDYSSIEPTCTEDGKAMRICYDCGGREYRVGSEKLGHDYIAGWTYGVMQQSRICARCTREQVVYYTSLSDKINKTTITGNVLGAENVDCLYNYNWEETTGTFCGRGGSVAVDIEFTEATDADYVYIKGQGGYTYTVSVLYEGDSEYTVIGTGAFGENATRFKIDGTITNAKISMENGGSGNGYWQEVAFAKIPEIE